MTNNRPTTMPIVNKRVVAQTATPMMIAVMKIEEDVSHVNLDLLNLVKEKIRQKSRAMKQALIPRTMP